MKRLIVLTALLQLCVMLEAKEFSSKERFGGEPSTLTKFYTLKVAYGCMLQDNTND